MGRNESQKTILAVDDESVILGYVASVLRPMGFRILEAVSGLQALTICENHLMDIDLLLTDIHMSPMNGVDLAKAVRERIPLVRVLYMTGFSHADELISSEVSQGKANYLAKPFSPQMLSQKVLEILGKEMKG